MKYLSEIDKERTVILVQPENEVGVFQEMDYCPPALVAYEKEVPQELLTYLEVNKNILGQHLKEIWENNGSQKNGTWKEVFGDTPFAKEFFMAWHYADYIDEIAREGKNDIRCRCLSMHGWCNIRNNCRVDILQEDLFPE